MEIPLNFLVASDYRFRPGVDVSVLPVNRMATPEFVNDGPTFMIVLSFLVLFQMDIIFFIVHAVCFILELFGNYYRSCSMTNYNFK